MRGSGQGKEVGGGEAAKEGGQVVGQLGSRRTRRRRRGRREELRQWHLGEMCSMFMYIVYTSFLKTERHFNHLVKHNIQSDICFE